MRISNWTHGFKGPNIYHQKQGESKMPVFTEHLQISSMFNYGPFLAYEIRVGKTRQM